MMHSQFHSKGLDRSAVDMLQRAIEELAPCVNVPGKPQLNDVLLERVFNSCHITFNIEDEGAADIMYDACLNMQTRRQLLQSSRVK